MTGARAIRFAAFAPTSTPDGQGGFIAGFAPAGSVWGRIDAATPRWDGDLDGPRIRSLCPVIVRERPAVGVNWRLVGAGRTFLVTAIDAAAIRPGNVRLFCLEETP